MPTAGLPVASTITSISPRYRPCAASAVKVVAAIRPRPSRRCCRPRARAPGSRSTMTGTSSPGVCGTCDRNIEPNLPAPISATRTGLPAAARALRRRERFMEDDPIDCRHSGARDIRVRPGSRDHYLWMPGSPRLRERPGMTASSCYSAACRWRRASRSSASSSTVSIGVKSRWAI